MAKLSICNNPPSTGKDKLAKDAIEAFTNSSGIFIPIPAVSCISNLMQA